jgi:Zn-finger nucleic acid-binding protein
VTLHTEKMDSVTIDECRQCGGIWFDHGELDQVIETTDPDLRWLDVNFWRSRSDFSVAPDSIGCPKCSRYYLTRIEDRTTETALALCSDCRGIWVDGDQLHAILRAILRCADSMESADYVKESLRQVADMIQTASEKPLSVSSWRDLGAVLRMLRYRIYSEHPKLVSMLVGTQKALPL